MRIAIVMNDGYVCAVTSAYMPTPMMGMDYVQFANGAGRTSVMRWSAIQFMAELPENESEAQAAMDQLRHMVSK